MDITIGCPFGSTLVIKGDPSNCPPGFGVGKRMRGGRVPEGKCSPTLYTN